MTAQILYMSDYKMDWKASEALCLECKYECVSVHPAMTETLECPECGGMTMKPIETNEGTQ